ncbi:hypothetical protein IKE13_03110 [Candidatus Saccharibacteria bacterium]|nr:hypothetical protein [Candidatus Saccharibacteria bacterium]
MSGVMNKLRQFRYKMKHDFLTLENVVLVAAIILCLTWTYQSIVAMSRNWELSERLTTERKTLELLSMEAKSAELENDYYRTEEYQELMARKYLEKKLPGEQMVVMPENSEAAKSRFRQDSEEVKEKEYSNFEKWMMYLFPSY